MTAPPPPAAPWDPQPGEPGTSFAGFVLYRESPPQQRSLRRVAERLGRSLSLVERYSARWHWVERTHAFDAEQARRRAERAREVETDWVERHADAGRRVQAISLAGLSNLIQRGPDGRVQSLRQLRPAELVSLFRAGSAVEAAARSHAAGSLEQQFVTEVIEIMTTVFVEANQHAEPEARAQAFEAGCARAFRRLTAADA